MPMFLPIHQIVLRWEIEQLQRPLSKGLKAVVMVCYILPLRMLNTTSKRLVDADFDASKLFDILHHARLFAYGFCYRVDAGLRFYGLADWVKVVEHMLQFRKSKRSHLARMHGRSASEPRRIDPLTRAAVTYDQYGFMLPHVRND